MTSARWLSIFAWVGAPSAGICLAVVFTPSPDAALHVSPVWAWLLTFMQLGGMWLAGRGREQGWLLGAVTQPGWIAYAILSAQYGFIPGCAVSFLVQVTNYCRQQERQSATALDASAAPAVGALVAAETR